MTLIIINYNWNKRLRIKILKKYALLFDQNNLLFLCIIRSNLGHFSIIFTKDFLVQKKFLFWTCFSFPNFEDENGKKLSLQK